jgi:hypothetical protein
MLVTVVPNERKERGTTDSTNDYKARRSIMIDKIWRTFLILDCSGSHTHWQFDDKYASKRRHLINRHNHQWWLTTNVIPAQAIFTHMR